MKVLTKLLQNNIPVAFLSVAPTAQAVEIVKDFREQGLNVVILLVVDNTSSPANLDFDVVHVKDAAKLYPQPEYVWVTTSIEANFAKKFMNGCKIIMPASIRKKVPNKFTKYL